jgi:hypothetical protein
MRRKGTQIAIDLLNAIAKEFGVDTKSLRQPYRFQNLVAARKAFCDRGRNELGIEPLTLALVINRHHTTVLYHSSPEMQRRKRHTRTAGSR